MTSPNNPYGLSPEAYATALAVGDRLADRATEDTAARMAALLARNTEYTVPATMAAA